MKVQCLILFCLVPLFSIAQIDTLIIDNGTLTCKEDFVKGKELHKLRISLYLFPPYYKGNNQNRKTKRYYKQLSKTLEENLHSVKVLYWINPTELSVLMNDSGKVVGIDTCRASLYKLNFSKMTALKVVYIIGDDTDYITDFPDAFYLTPVNLIHYCQIQNGDLLTRNINARKKDINVIRETQEDRDYYINFLH